MAQGTFAEIESRREMSSRRSEDGDDVGSSGTADVHDTAMKIERASEACKVHAEVMEKPGKLEVYIWYFYEFCSYFIQTVLVPICFTLHLAEIKGMPPEPARGWNTSPKGLSCHTKEAQMYVSLTYRSISVGNSKFSPLEWASFSWGIGLFLAALILGSISIHLDHGQKQVIIAGASIVLGTFFCLPTGFFNVTWIFPPYIAFMIAASIIASATHTRHLGIMIRCFTGPKLQKSQLHFRHTVASWLSLYSTAAGSLGAAIISAFIFHMLDYKEKTLSLWVISIFSCIIWILGIAHVALYKPGPNTISPISSLAHFLSIFKYPHAYGNLIIAFLSSFTTMCIFTSMVLYVVGQLCLKPVFVLYLWLVYFIFPMVSMPLTQPLQQLIKSNNGVKMYLLGFYLSTVTSGSGFYFLGRVWERKHILIFAGLQSSSVGLLHAFGRVLMLDCCPHGKEGVFSAWFSWARAFGTCAGFAVASAIPESSSTSFAISFCTAIAGGLILIYSNISDSEGAAAAGNVIEYCRGEPSSPVQGLDSMVEPSREDLTN